MRPKTDYDNDIQSIYFDTISYKGNYQYVIEKNRLIKYFSIMAYSQFLSFDYFINYYVNNSTF